MRGVFEGSMAPSLGGGTKEELSISQIVYPVIRTNFKMGTPHNTIQDNKVPLHQSAQRRRLKGEGGENWYYKSGFVCFVRTSEKAAIISLTV
jgi:hypothetical protein